MTLCTYVLRIEGRTSIRCIAQADETGLCPAHRERPTTAVGETRSHPARVLEHDVLPWTENDQAIYAVHERRAPKQRNSSDTGRRHRADGRTKAKRAAAHR